MTQMYNINRKKVFLLKKRGDVIVVIFIIIIIICAIAFYLPKLFGNSSPSIATITYNGNIVKTINLTADRVYSYPVYDSQDNELCYIEVEDGKVHFQSSTCPDQLCVNAPWMEHSGDYVVCAPNKVVVTVK